jgi:glycosyltransferase involved in cell wall biosynthesis
VSERARIPVVRVIARLNIGGPAIQAISLTRYLDECGYDTTLVRGREEPDEGNMDHLAAQLDVRPVLIGSLRRNPGWHDVRALAALINLIRHERPQIVHTHAAKGGTLGRIATVLACPRRRSRPVLVHTYHGHSLSGYFSPRATAVYRAIEQLLAHATDRLIAVGDEVRDELVALGVAPASKFEVIPLGFDLSPFQRRGDERSDRRRALRTELGLPLDAPVVTLVARLVPIKRVDRFLRVASIVARGRDVRFLIVGDGELRSQLTATARDIGLGSELTFAGFRRDMPDVCFASDVVVLTSDNEGTPVSLIEAQAAGTPVVSTGVGGVATVVRDGHTGFVVSTEDEPGMASAIERLITDRELASRLGRAAAEHAAAFSLDRLTADIDRLYSGLLTYRERGIER